jgi:hypothetical protein
METQTGSRNAVSTLVRWLVNIAWTLVWGVLLFACLNTLGATAAAVAVAGIIIVSLAVWYLTERRQSEDGDRENRGK